MVRRKLEGKEGREELNWSMKKNAFGGKMDAMDDGDDLFAAMSAEMGYLLWGLGGIWLTFRLRRIGRREKS
jgi:hypothetical protein